MTEVTDIDPGEVMRMQLQKKKKLKPGWRQKSKHFSLSFDLLLHISHEYPE